MTVRMISSRDGGTVRGMGAGGTKGSGRMSKGNPPLLFLLLAQNRKTLLLELLPEDIRT
jgi:hypothetical protein